MGPLDATVIMIDMIVVYLIIPASLTSINLYGHFKSAYLLHHIIGYGVMSYHIVRIGVVGFSQELQFNWTYFYRLNIHLDVFILMLMYFMIIITSMIIHRNKINDMDLPNHVIWIHQVRITHRIFSLTLYIFLLLRERWVANPMLPYPKAFRLGCMTVFALMYLLMYYRHHGVARAFAR